MGNVIGEPFKRYVDEQIKKRQKIHGKKIRDAEDITYLNSTLAWVKLASGVSLTQERLDLLKVTYGSSIVNNIQPGKELALKNVLFNGLTSMGDTNLTSTPDGDLSSREFLNFMSKNETAKFKQKQRTGYTSRNGTYSNDPSLGGTEFGIVPMPGIISVDSQDLNRGSIKKSRVKIKAYNKQQFDIIDVLYLRLGYTVLLEFGNSHYLDTGGSTFNQSTKKYEWKDRGGKLEKMRDTLIDTDFFRVDENYYDLLQKIEIYRERYRGNYNALLGKIVNFSWTFAKDGTYDIDLDIISIGDVIESLKLNLPPVKSIGNYTAFADRQAVLSQLSTRVAGDLKEFFTIYPNLEGALDTWYDNAVNEENDATKESIKFTLSATPLNPLTMYNRRDYDNRNPTQLEGFSNGHIVMSNQRYAPVTSFQGFRDTSNDGANAGSKGTISINYIPDGNAIGTDVLDKQHLSDLLKEAITFAFIMKINGYYGGTGFANPYNFLYIPSKSTTIGQQQRQSLADKLTGGDVDQLTDQSFKDPQNPLWANLSQQKKDLINLFDQKFVNDTLDYSLDGGKTTPGLVGTNTLPSSVKTIVGKNWNDAKNIDYRGGENNKYTVKTKATFNPEREGGDGDWYRLPVYATAYQAQLNVDEGAYGIYTNSKQGSDTVNFYNATKDYVYSSIQKKVIIDDLERYQQLGPYYRHLSLWFLLYGDTYNAENLDYEPNILARKFAQKYLLQNISKTEFKQLVFMFFKEMNAAGGTEDNQFKEDPTFASYSQELEFEKNKDRIHSWLYRVRKYYTGITPSHGGLYQIKDAQGNVLKSQKPGQVFGPITVNGPLHKVKIGKILNPYDLYKKNATSNSTSAEAQKANENFQLDLVDGWAKSVGYPTYTTGSGVVDYFVLDDFKVSSGGSGEFNLSGDGRYRFFVKLKVLLDFIEDRIIPSIIPSVKNGKKVPLLKIDTDTNSNICYAIDNMMSTNIKSCIIRNDEFYCLNEIGTSFRNKLFEGIDYFLGNSANSKYIYGRPMNIYLNFEFIQSLLDKIKGKTGDAILFDFLKNICDEINSCLGNVNNLEPVIDHDTNTIKIIDQTPIPGLDEILKSLKDDNKNKAYPNFTPNDPAILELYGYNGNTSNFVHNVGLTTTISKRYASMITIGATADGSIPGMEATAFSKWNTGVIDRVKPEIVDGATYTKETVKQQNEEVIKRYINLIQINDSDLKFKLLGLSTDGTFNAVYQKNNPQIVSDYFNYAQAQSSKSGSLESSVGFLPFNLKIDMEGISGMKIYNRLHVDTRFLPSNYPETLDFIITKVNHKLANNNWTTTLETQATKIIEDEKNVSTIDTKELLDGQDVQAILSSSPDTPFKNGDKPSYFVNNDSNGHLQNTPGTAGGKISIDQILDCLHPEVRTQYKKFLTRLESETTGYKYSINASFRTFTRSSQFYRKNYAGNKKRKWKSDKPKYAGVTTPSTAYPGHSPHNFGVALDISVVDLENTTVVYSNRKIPQSKKAIYEKLPLVIIAKEEGFSWGGDYSGYWDPVHFNPKNIAFDNVRKQLFKAFGFKESTFIKTSKSDPKYGKLDTTNWKTLSENSILFDTKVLISAGKDPKQFYEQNKSEIKSTSENYNLNWLGGKNLLPILRKEIYSKIKIY